MKVYLMHGLAWKGDNYSKIGISKDSRKRMQQLRHTELPFLLTLAVDFEAGIMAREVESYLHKYFSSVRLSGEWFYGLLDEREFLLTGLEMLDAFWKHRDAENSAFLGRPLGIYDRWFPVESQVLLGSLRKETR